MRTALPVVPGRTRTANRTGRRISRTTTRAGTSTSPSIVAGTAPSTELSSGTQAATASPARTASSAAVVLVTGTVPGRAAGGRSSAMARPRGVGAAGRAGMQKA